jgi:hypothetical protein
MAYHKANGADLRTVSNSIRLPGMRLADLPTVRPRINVRKLSLVLLRIDKKITKTLKSHIVYCRSGVVWLFVQA